MTTSVTVYLAPAPVNVTQFIPGGNVPAAGAKLFCYAAGSSSKQNVYTSNLGNVAWANPIVLDSGGNQGGEVWIPAGLPAKFILAPSNDQDPPISPYWTADNITGINDPTVSQSEWIPGPSPTFFSGTSFTLVGDQTLIFTVGRRIKTTNTSGTVYGTIISSVFSSLTSITIDTDNGTSLDSGLSAVWYSIINSTNASIYKIPGGLQVLGTSSGVLAAGGIFYDHVALAICYQGNPLTNPHQVGGYSAIHANANANGASSFSAGFETAIGTSSASFALEKAVNYSCSAFDKGAGSTVSTIVGLNTFEETAGINNASIANSDNSTLTGNWFINYSKTRPSALAGGLMIGNSVGFNVNVGMLYITGSFTGAAHSFGHYMDATMAPPINGDAVGVRLNPLFNTTSSGTHGNFAAMQIDAPTVSSGGATLTNATTLKILGAPTAGTKKRAFWVSSGTITFNNLPTASTGLASGDLWTNSNVLTVVP